MVNSIKDLAFFYKIHQFINIVIPIYLTRIDASGSPIFTLIQLVFICFIKPIRTLTLQAYY